ncbi:MAG: Xaa-Pro peptidase family protein [Coriobacteriales bacterium]|jgi:Xaa-Pro aminopeptidase|nr:Xaa-Pro peptidase family protein [Coriobacteriales bacterium]
MVASRLARLLDTLALQGIDVYLATHTADIHWLTGFSGVFDEEQAHLALVAADHGPLFFTDTRYSGALARLDVQGRWRILDERRPRPAYVAERVKGLFGSRPQDRPLHIGIEGDLRLDSYRALVTALDGIEGLAYRLVETSGLVRGLRACKDAREIEILKAAQEITDAAFGHMLGYLRPGLSERDAANELETFMRRAGADAAAFPTIVATGPNSAVPHAVPGGRAIDRGDLVLMDFGARLEGYRSDMTRTVVMGAPSRQQRAMHEAARAAQAAVMAMLRPGVSGLEAQALADEAVAAHGFEGRLIHALGHGVGIDIHELPTLGPKVEAVLEEGNVVTVEPGVYLEGIGGVRIEDYGLVTSEGFEDFTRSPHDLVSIPL